MTDSINKVSSFDRNLFHIDYKSGAVNYILFQTFKQLVLFYRQFEKPSVVNPLEINKLNLLRIPIKQVAYTSSKINFLSRINQPRLP